MTENGARLRSSIPNQITVARLACVPLLMYFLLWDTHTARITALVLFFVAAATDAVDGYLARTFQQTSVFGKFADPIADKLLVVGALVCLLQLGELNAVWVMIIIAREFLVTGLRILAMSEGQVIPASLLGKMKTVAQVALVVAMLLGRAFSVGSWIVIAEDVILGVALALTAVSGVEYFVRCRRLLA